MIKLNNKGQSLIIFVLVLPILLGIMALVVDLGNALSKKNEIDNVIEFVLDYQLDNNDYLDNDSQEESIKVLLDYNLKNSDNTVLIKNDTITISSQTYVDGIFSNILNIKGFKIESEYEGYIKDKQQIINKKK